MVDRLAAHITQLVQQQLTDVDSDRAEVIRYGLALIIWEIVSAAISLGLALLLKQIPAFLVAFLTYAILRSTAGGSHARSRTSCAISYNLLLFGSVWLSTMLPAGSHPWLWIFPLCAVPVFMRYAPGDTIEKPLSDTSRRHLLRTLSLALLLVTGFAAWLLSSVFPPAGPLYCLQTLIVSFLLTPAGYHLTGAIRGSPVTRTLQEVER